MNKYPMQRQARSLANQGRYGDTELLHVNKAELAGIASLTPGGLTRNPQTGQPEAFAFLIPMLASWGASTAAGAGLLGAGLSGAAGTALGAFGPALAGGIASGVSTAAITGDAKRGLVSGITGAALGGATNTALQPDVIDEAVQAGIDPTIAKEAMAATPAYGNLPANTASGGYTAGSMKGATDLVKPKSGWPFAGPKNSAARPMMADLSGAGAGSSAAAEATKLSFGQAAKNQLSGPNNLMSSITEAKYFVPFALGAGQGAAMEAEAEREEQFASQRAKNEEKRRKMQGLIGAGYRGRPGYADGGIVRLERGGPAEPNPDQPTDQTQTSSTTVNVSSGSKYTPEEIAAMRDALFGAYGIDPSVVGGLFAGYQGNDGAYRTPTSVQDYLHQFIPLQYDKYSPFKTVAPPQDYMPGFNPEFSYIQRKGANYIPDYEKGPYGWMNPMVSYQSPINRALYPKPQYWPEASGWNSRWYARMPQPNLLAPRMPGTGPGSYPSVPGMAEGGVAPGGIAALGSPQPALPQQQQGPSPQELEMVAMAIAGQAGEQGQKIIDMFIQRYGPDVFRKVREMVLQAIQPNAQTEGMVQGPGGGMDDQVRGMIGAQQPVAVSPGEYIVPADVVSGLGDGSSDAGAQELDQMAQKVRMARGGSTMQPPAIEASRYMPR